MFVPASALPVLVGTAWGWRDGDGLHVGLFLAALLGMICLHFGANVINDVGDDLNGCDARNDDRIFPFTGGSRVIQDKVLTRTQMGALGLGLLSVGALIGYSLFLIKGETVLWLGALGGFLAIAYSLPPLSLASRGWGEATVALAFGLPVWACAWLQSDSFTADSFFAALAMGCWSACILIVNEIPDRLADSQSAKRTLVVRLSPTNVRWLYLGASGAAGVCACFAALVSKAPIWALLPPILLLIFSALPPVRCNTDRDQMLKAIQATLAMHLVGGLWLIALAGL